MKDNKIFWLLATSLALAFTYIFVITFISIPKDNVRFADTAQGFFLGTVIGNVISFFVGGSPKKHPLDTVPDGTTTSANIEVVQTTKETPNEN